MESTTKITERMKRALAAGHGLRLSNSDIKDLIDMHMSKGRDSSNLKKRFDEGKKLRLSFTDMVKVANALQITIGG